MSEQPASESGGIPLRDSWFGKAHSVGERAPESLRVVTSIPPPKPEGRVSWALLFGAIGGAVGGIAMLYTAVSTARRLGHVVDIIGVVGHAAPRALFAAGEHTAGLVVASTVGALTGALLGLLLRYILRIPARVFVGITLSPVLWTAIHAFLLKSTASLPFVPMVVGAVAYGACATVLPPLRVRR